MNFSSVESKEHKLYKKKITQMSINKSLACDFDMFPNSDFFFFFADNSPK